MFRPTSVGLFLVLALALASSAAPCQENGPPPPGPGDANGPPPMEGRRPPMERAFHLGPRGRWWNNPELVQKLALTSDQQKKMDVIFQQSRPSLMDLSSALRNEEVAMEPLLAADQPDEGKILGQIDRVAQARAELEKANARMLLGLRRVLTPEQWKTLQAGEPHEHYPHYGHGPRGDTGPNP